MKREEKRREGGNEGRGKIERKKPREEEREVRE